MTDPFPDEGRRDREWARGVRDAAGRGRRVGRIGRLTLDQPAKLNPLGSNTLREIADAAAWFDTTEASVVVVTGEGRAFSSGFDLREFAGRGDGERRAARPTSDGGWPRRSSGCRR